MAATAATTASGTDGDDVETVAPGAFHPFRPRIHDQTENQETNTSRPLNDAVITVRIIKSFAYRSMKALVIPHIDLTAVTVEELEERCRKEVSSSSTFKAFRSYVSKLDTIKIYTRAHGAKTTNLIINLDRPEWLLDSEKDRKLSEVGLENEAEVSFFNRQDYEDFLADPTTKW